MAHRDLLALHKIDEFAAWAVTQGYVREETKGSFEVLRLRKGNDPPKIYFTRAGAKEHASCQDASVGLVRRWIRERDDVQAIEDDAMRNMGLDDAVRFGLEDVGDK